MSEMPGITAFSSQTNFILFKAASDAAGIYLKLRQKGILIKNLDKPGPLNNCLRVTVGKPEENREFLTTLKKILTAN